VGSEMCIRDRSKSDNAAGCGFLIAATGTPYNPGDVQILNAEFLNFADEGIDVEKGWGTTISNTIVESNGSYGIKLYSHDQTYIDNCSILYNGEDGLYIAGNRAVVTNCYIAINEKNGINLVATNTAISNCAIVNWGGGSTNKAGIFIGGHYNAISNCIIDGANDADADRGIFIDLACHDNIITGVTIRRTDVADLYLRGDDNIINALYGTITRNGDTFCLLNGVGEESANAEEPQHAWRIGSIINFTDSGDASGDGVYIKDIDGNWVKLA